MSALPSIETPSSGPHPFRRSIAGPADAVRAELDRFESDVARYRAGLVPDPVFMEMRLRFGVYGQRQDGVHMMRSKLPLGLMTVPQLLAMADVAEAFGAGVAHITTRQDIQVHFVKLEATAELMRVLDAADMTSREACGNVVRNVTAAEMSGVHPAEPFDVTPYGMALARFLLKHPEAQSLGRKFKIHLTGTIDPDWDLTAIHDIGLRAAVRDGVRGFEFFVGGGLGPVPQAAQLLAEFVSEDDLLPLAQAVLMVFARHGEKKNRARARMKFLVAQWGIERFREEVVAVRAAIPEDPIWRTHLSDLDRWEEHPAQGPGTSLPVPRDDEDALWLRTNVLPQRQPGYATVRVKVPRGDLSPDQLRGLARLVAEAVGPDTVRFTADQGVVIRWVSTDALPVVREGLRAIGLGDARAGGFGDPVTCPGSDTCKLGITSPRKATRHAADLLDRLAGHPRLEKLRIKISGCPNACAQHHIADIGFYGAARTAGGAASPHFIVMLGGRPDGSGFGTTIGKVPALKVGEAIERITGLYLAESAPDEAFASFVRRTDRRRFQALIQEFQEIPSPEAAPEYYREPGDAQGFTVRRGTGECAGAVVTETELWLSQADGEADRATAERSASAARAAMVWAARALLATEHVHAEQPADVLARFREVFYDTGRIPEGTGFYFVSALTEEAEVTGDRLRRLVIEAELFVQEVHSMVSRLGVSGAAAK